MMKYIEQWIINLFGSVDNVVLGFFTRIGPYITAAIPALLAGYGISSYFDTSFGMIMGFAVGIGMEAAGIKIIHTAIEYKDDPDHKSTDTKFVLLTAASILFVVLVSATIYTSEQAYPQMVRLIGAISPTLAAMAYFAIGVERSMHRESASKEAEFADEIEHKRATKKLELQSERIRLEAEARALEVRLKAETEAEVRRIEAESKAAQAKIEAETRAYEANQMAAVQKRVDDAATKREIKLLKEQAKLEDQTQTSSTNSRRPPFRRYEEFAEILKETEDIKEIAKRMSLTTTTIRDYRRKFDRFQAEIVLDSSSNKTDENVTQLDQTILNGHI